MKVLLLADINSPHTQKWAIALSEIGIEVNIFTLSEATIDWYSEKNIKVSFGNINKPNRRASILVKLSYFKGIGVLRSFIEEIKPDIVHAHYATSYGMLGALSNFKPFIISVWGSDVFDFPKKSIVHKFFLKYVLNKTSLILSTSHIMANETAKYTTKKIQVLPFGIDTNVFKPSENKSFEITIGTIKSFEPIYGIDFLIKSFKVITELYPELPLRLLLVGSGSQDNKFKELVADLGISNKTTFAGKIPYNEVVQYHNKIDIFVNVSIHESFGVSVIEASACETAIIASNVGGLAEVVDENVTGVLIPHSDVKALTNAIESLLLDEQKRIKMGKNGRKKVIKLYSLQKNIEEMIMIYQSLKK